MATREICGQPTEKGPCTLEPNHKLNYHRHRVYDTVEWVITTPKGKELVKGTGRLGLQYALNDAFIKSTKIIINAELVIRDGNVVSGGIGAERPTPPEGIVSVPLTPAEALNVQPDSDGGGRTEALTIRRVISTIKECSWCGNDISKLKENNIYCSIECKSQAHKAAPCFYCGMPAAEKEHIIPLSVKKHNNTETVPTCYECNRLASANEFKTIEDKKKFIKNKIAGKYKRILDAPDWTEIEIDELGPLLKAHVLAFQDLKLIIARRLVYDG